MNVVHIYHSGFVLLHNDIAVVIDYYKDPHNVLSNILQHVKYLYVLSSHAHQDHFNKDILEWGDYCDNIVYLLSYDIKKKIKKQRIPECSKSIIFLNKYSTYSDDFIDIKTFDSTDVGISFLISFAGYKFFHAGDLNNWRWEEESTEKEMQDADKSFNAILKKIKDSVNEHIDCVMFPVDARMKGDYAIGARQFVNSIKVRYFIPMHTWGMWEKSADFNKYRNDNYGEYICLKEGECLNLDNI